LQPLLPQPQKALFPAPVPPFLISYAKESPLASVMIET
jgi:hypothetical protein